jgi:hypothetical protein
MHGRMRRVAVSAIMVATVGLAPALMSTTSASAWFRGGTQGCTPGYWKNHTSAWADTSYAPTDTVGSVFTLPADLSSFGSETLLAALNGGGGPDLNGATEILLRAAVASLLNASDPNVQFGATTASIIKKVNTALATENRDKILALATKLDTRNNLGCPLN